MGSTYKCNICKEMYRVSCKEELEEYQEEHRLKCSGTFESIWKNYNKMTKEEKEFMGNAVMFKYGRITT